MSKRTLVYRNPGEEHRATITVVQSRPPRVSVELGPDIVVENDEVNTDVFLAICEPTWPIGAGGSGEQAREQLAGMLEAWFRAVPVEAVIAEFERRDYRQLESQAAGAAR